MTKYNTYQDFHPNCDIIIILSRGLYSCHEAFIKVTLHQENQVFYMFLYV